MCVVSVGLKVFFSVFSIWLCWCGRCVLERSCVCECVEFLGVCFCFWVRVWRGFVFTRGCVFLFVYAFFLGFG